MDEIRDYITGKKYHVTCTKNATGSHTENVNPRCVGTK